jgi:hypothetical protein
MLERLLVKFVRCFPKKIRTRILIALPKKVEKVEGGVLKI